MQSLVEQSDLSAAKACVRDLETSWDEAEAALKPCNAAAWHRVDKAIDKALRTLRAAAPDASACKAVLEELLTTIDVAS